MTNLFSSSGRIPRSTFWIFTILFYCIAGGLGYYLENSQPSETVRIVAFIVLLPLILIAILMQIKRWHDRDKSGWWIFINFVPCVGGLWTLVECGFLPGTPGPNRFGPDPLQ